MGRLTGRLPATEQTTDTPARVRPPAGVDLSPEESPEETVTRLQSTIGNDGMAAMVGGAQTLGGATPDGGTAPDLDPDAGPPPVAGAGPAPATNPDAAPAPGPDGGLAGVPGGASAPGTTPGGPPPAPAPAAGPTPGGPQPGGPQPGGPASSGPQPGGPQPGGPQPGGPTPGGPRPGQAPAAGDELTDESPTGPDTGADDLDTPMLELVDEELAEHERWAAAGTRVGEAGSEARADFIATEVGAGMGSSFGDAFLMGAGLTIGIGAVEEAIPGIGQVVGGVFAVKAIMDGALGRDAAAVSRMGEGRSGYEEAANDIEGVCAILDIATNLVNLLAGVVGIVAVAATAAAFFTFGALAPLAIAAGEIGLAFGAAGAILGGVKMALQPLVVLFRSLHEFTSQADPRQIEADGAVLEEGGAEMGGALGGLAGAVAGGKARGGRHHEAEEPPPSTEPPPARPPARTASGELIVEAEPIPGRPVAPAPHEEVPTGGPTPHEEPPTAPAPARDEHPLANLSDEEIEAAVNAPPTKQPTPADFTDEDIDALVGRLDRPEQLETPQFAAAYPAGPDVLNPVTGRVEPAVGLSTMTIEGQSTNPNQIGYHENAYFRGVRDVREIDAFPTGPHPELPPAAQPPDLVPPTTVQIKGPSPGPNQPRPVLSQETGGNVEVRYHGPNPGAPEGTFSHDNPTVQVNTPNPHGSWTGQPVDEAAGQRAVIPHNDPNTGLYRTADGEWVRIPTATPEQRAAAHYPVYGEPTPLIEPPPSGGTPPTGGTQGGSPPSVIIDEAALGLQPGEVQTTQGTPRAPTGRTTDVDWNDPRVRSALGLDPVTGTPTGAKLGSPGQLEVDPKVGPWDPADPNAPGPFHGSLGQMKNGEYAPESYFQVTEQDGYAVRVGPPGAFVDHIFPTLAEAEAYARQLAGTGEAAIRETSALPHGWAPDVSGKVWPGNPVDEARVLGVPAGTPTLRSVVAPQPEGSPAVGRPTSYGGGGPQTQLPMGFFPRGATPGAPSPAQVGTPVPISDRAEGWYTRMMRYPGEERVAQLREQGEVLERLARLPEGAHRGEAGGKLLSGGHHGEGGHGEGGEGGEGGPVVEMVNPRYEPPPGTQADLDRLTEDIRRTLAARQRAEQERDHAERVRDAARRQGLNITKAGTDVTQGLTATQTHEGTVQQHGQAHERSATSHQEGGAKVQDASSRLAGVATLETLLAGWSGFTGVVLKFSSVLPDRAVNAFQRMNNDSTQFMARLAHIKTEVAGQQGQQPVRGTQIAQTGQRIATTGTRAQGTHARFVQAQQQAAELTQVNQEHVTTAEQDRAQAAGQATQADAAATGLLERRQSLSAELAAWAARHRAARQQAVDEAARRLEERGLRVTRRPEH